MPIFRSIWRFKSLSGICSTRWYFSLTLIDEGFIDLTSSLKLFYSRSLPLERKNWISFLPESKRIWQGNWIYSTIGLSNANPLLAKLALDNEADIAGNMRSNWSYEDVESGLETAPASLDFGALDVGLKKRLQRSGSRRLPNWPMAHPDLFKERIRSHGPSTVVPCSW